jgi:hypothetical protein
MTKEAIMVNHNTFGSITNINETYAYNQEGDVDKAFRVEDLNKKLSRNDDDFNEVLAYMIRFKFIELKNFVSNLRFI